jgi:hypothetical protein
MLIAVVILSVLLTLSICGLVAAYIAININLDKITTYESWILEFQGDIQQVYDRLKHIDDKQLFQKDDDVGFVFSEILKIVEKAKDKSK